MAARILAFAGAAAAWVYGLIQMVRSYRDAGSLLPLSQEQRNAKLHSVSLRAALVLASAFAAFTVILGLDSASGAPAVAIAVLYFALIVPVVYFTWAVGLRAWVWQLDVKSRGVTPGGYGKVTCTNCGTPSPRLSDWMGGELLDADAVAWVCGHCGYSNVIAPRAG